MATRIFYGTNLLVEQKTAELTEIETLDEGWTIKYLDQSTGEHWLKYTVDPDRGYHFNLMRTTPELGTSQLIDLALNSEFPDEARAAAYKLHLDEVSEHKEYRTELLEQIKKIYLDSKSPERKRSLADVIRASQLLDRVNSRELIGKSMSEIELDAKFFQRTAKEAQEIIEKLER
jgi:hypothetical protein